MNLLESLAFRLLWGGGPLALGALGALTFVAVALSPAGGGDELMDRPNRVAHLYGYTVCLVAVVTFLVSANALVRGAFALADPLRAEERDFGFETSVSSFDAFRATYMFGGARGAVLVGGSGARGADSAARADTLSSAELRARYEALRSERVGRARYQAAREVVTSALLMALATVLFALHWRWLRAREAGGNGLPGAPA